MAKSPRGFQRIAPSAPLGQVIQQVNDNLQTLFARLEQAFGGLDALKGEDAGRAFTLNAKSNPVVKTNTFGNPNDSNQLQPRDKVVLIEKSRRTEKVKIYNPDNEEMWVEILRITDLVLYDKQTGIEWVWKLGNIEEIKKEAVPEGT